jgi:hypothetical protein
MTIVGAAPPDVELDEAVVSATQLEGARALQALGLEQQAPADHLVERRAREQRRAAHDAGEPRGRGLDLGDARQGEGFVLRVHRVLC